MAQCNEFENFIFDTIQVYARPIAEIGEHHTDNTNINAKKQQQQNKQNAMRASKGYHHTLIILSGGPQPLQYLLDRVDAVRFMPIKIVENELISGHLILIKEYNEVNLPYLKIQPFIQQESVKAYNMAINNCIKFVYNFIDKIINKNEWHNFDGFWQFVQSHFDINYIKNGGYNQQKNELKQQKLIKEAQRQQFMRTLHYNKLRINWVINDTLLIKSRDFQARQSWYIGTVINTGKNDNLHIQYQKLGNTFNEIVNRYNKNKIKPYIKVPSSFFDPITNKIMTKPVQVLHSGMVYDEITVQYFQEIERGPERITLDPINGIPISKGDQKPFVMKKQTLESQIKKFMKTEVLVEWGLINDFATVNNPELWKDVWSTLNDKTDIKQQQKQIFGKPLPLFYPESQGQYCYDDKSDAILRWDFEHSFVYHTHIPFITFMGPSRIGKSYLLNEILRSQSQWKTNKQLRKKDVFATSDSSNIAETKGSWITLYGEVEQELHAPPNDAEFVDPYLFEDDITMWSTDELIQWLYTLHPTFNETYSSFIETIKQKQIDANNIEYLLERAEQFMTPYAAVTFKNILQKRITNLFDAIDSDKINQMYLIDMEGLSHGATAFTKKLFEGTYAVSNVMVWFDAEVMSDSFKHFMFKLKDNMKNVANSKRKPSLLYVRRNSNLPPYFDYGVVNNCNVNNNDNQFDDDEEDEEEVDSSKDLDTECERSELDQFIKNDESFAWFRKMNIFSSIHAHQLHSPTTKTLKRSGHKVLRYESITMEKLMKKIKKIANVTLRFANNANLLNEQVNNINEVNKLSIEKRIALTNSKLKWFVFSPKEDRKQLQLTNAVITFNYTESKTRYAFDKGYESLTKQLSDMELVISNQFYNELRNAKNEILKEIKNIMEKRKAAKKSNQDIAVMYYGLGWVGIYLAVVTPVSIPLSVPILFYFSGVPFGASVYHALLWNLPELDKEIQEEQLGTLNYVDNW
eukprot:99682_1